MREKQLALKKVTLNLTEQSSSHFANFYQMKNLNVGKAKKVKDWNLINRLKQTAE